MVDSNKNDIKEDEILKEMQQQIYNKLKDNEELFIEKAFKEKVLEKSLEISKFNKIEQNLNTGLLNIKISNEMINTQYHYEEISLLESDIKLIRGSLKNYHKYIKFQRHNLDDNYNIDNPEIIDLINLGYKKLSYLLSYLMYITKRDISEKINFETIIQSPQFIESILSLSTSKRLIKLNERILEYNRIKKIEDNIENLKIDLEEKSVEFKNPVEEFIEARKMNRHFIIHTGQTNTGKTYQALQDLKSCNKGVYLAPLRLLAIEIQDE